MRKPKKRSKKKQGKRAPRPSPTIFDKIEASERTTAMKESRALRDKARSEEGGTFGLYGSGMIVGDSGVVGFR